MVDVLAANRAKGLRSIGRVWPLELAYHQLDATGMRDGYWLAWMANVELIRRAFRRAHDPSIEAVAGELLAVIEAPPEGNTRISCSAARWSSTITR